MQLAMADLRALDAGDDDGREAGVRVGAQQQALPHRHGPAHHRARHHRPDAAHLERLVHLQSDAYTYHVEVWDAGSDITRAAAAVRKSHSTGCTADLQRLGGPTRAQFTCPDRDEQDLADLMLVVSCSAY